MIRHLLPIHISLKRTRRAGVERAYFIKDLVTGYVKIGRTVNPTKRLKSLQTGNPNKLVILATIIPKLEWGVTAKKLEGELHQRFASSCVGGEWFHQTEELRVLIELARHNA